MSRVFFVNANPDSIFNDETSKMKKIQRQPLKCLKIIFYLAYCFI